MTRNWDGIITQLTHDIKAHFTQEGFDQAVIGISGGIDSAVVANLLVKALGREKVHGFLLPYGSQDMNDAHLVRVALGLDCDNSEVNIKPTVDTYFKEVVAADDLRRGNMMARVRMAALYDQAKKIGALVVGTTNRTEFQLGYYTLWGDGSCDVEVISRLYKTEIFELAKHMGIPDEIIEKPPSAELWEGQTDEGEIGLSYQTIDSVLMAIEDAEIADDETLIGKHIEDGEFTEDDIKKVIEIIVRNHFKQTVPAYL